MSRSNLFGGETPRYFFLFSTISFFWSLYMRDLSIHVDESGDFGDYSSKFAPYYIFSLVFHEQCNDISDSIFRLDTEMAKLGFLSYVIHTGPLIRKEEVYCNLPPNDRRAIFSRLYYFVISIPIRYKTFDVARKEYPDAVSLRNRIHLLLSRFFENNLPYFLSFDRIILYYDNGQSELSQVLLFSLQEKFSSLIRKSNVHQYQYKLLQAADMLCTLRLLEIKAKNNSLSKSELCVFHSAKELRKDFLKRIKGKEF